MVYLVAGICILNVVLWIAFAVRFRKIFSTDEIVSKTKTEVEKVLRDMQRQTSYNIDLLNGTIDRLRIINAEAEKKIDQLNKKLALVNSDMNAKQGATQIRDTIRQSVRPAVKPTDVYQVNKPALKDLFEEPQVPVKDEVILTREGAAYREVPVISTRILEEKKASGVSRKDSSEKVLELYNQGYSVDDIVKELKLSVTEVQFIIDMAQ